jgi:hypothetical protein
MTDPLHLFEEVVTCSGLASFIGPGTVQRALQSVGVTSPSLAKLEDYRRALPALQERMALYLPASQLKACVRAIETLLKLESAKASASGRKGGNSVSQS